MIVAAMNSSNDNAAFDPSMIDDIVAGLAGKPGALMLVLHAVNESVGYIPVEAVPAIRSKPMKRSHRLAIAKTVGGGDCTDARAAVAAAPGGSPTPKAKAPVAR